MWFISPLAALHINKEKLMRTKMKFYKHGGDNIGRKKQTELTLIVPSLLLWISHLDGGCFELEML